MSMIPWLNEENIPLVHFCECEFHMLPNFSVFQEKLMAPTKLISSFDKYVSFPFCVWIFEFGGIFRNVTSYILESL